MSVRSILAFGSTALLALGLSLPITTNSAQAATMTAIDIINTYNLVVFGDLKSTSEVDGRTFVGGDLVSSGSTSNYAIHNSQLPASTAPALTVGGNVMGAINVNGPGLTVGGSVGGSSTTHPADTTFHSANVTMNGGGNVLVGGNVVGSTIQGNFNGNGSVYVKGSIKTGPSPSNTTSNVNANGGSIYVGGTVQAGNTANANGGGSLHQNSSVPSTMSTDVASQATEMHKTLTKFSSYLGSLTVANSNIIVAGGTATFNATPDKNGVAIFNITNPSAVFSQGQFQFNIGSATALFINVLNVGATQLNIGANFLGGIATTLAKDTLWNFVDAQNINITKQFGGSILALLANITTSGNIEGSVIAQSVTQNAEIHYNGQVTLPTPVPAALPLFAAAIGGLAGWRALRRKSDAKRLAA